MTTADDKLKRAIDESIEPLVKDHLKYLANALDPALAVGRTELHYVFDQYGTALLDFSNTLQPVGHLHPFMVSALQEHLRYYLHTAPAGHHVLRWPVEYSRDLVRSFGVEGDHQILFTEGEREAVLTAISIARQMSGKSRVALVDTCVHDWVSEHNHVNIRLLPVEEFWLKDFRWEDVGCLIMSLVRADGRMLEDRWVQQVCDAAAHRGVPVIIDESQTGFGRLGTMWGQQSLGVDADITVLGGSVGGGMALGGVFTSKAKFDEVHWDLSPQSGSPLACAAGANLLRALNPGVIEHVKEAGEALHQELNSLIFDEYLSGFVVATHGRGLWRVLEFQSVGYADQFVLDCRRHGLLLSPPPVGESSVIITPTLNASTQEITRGVGLMSEVLMEWVDKDMY